MTEMPDCRAAKSVEEATLWQEACAIEKQITKIEDLLGAPSEDEVKKALETKEDSSIVATIRLSIGKLQHLDKRLDVIRATIAQMKTLVG